MIARRGRSVFRAALQRQEEKRDGLDRDGRHQS